MAHYKGFVKKSGPDNLTAFPEADSETFYAGQPVGLTSGQVVALSDAAEADILGISTRDSNNDTNNYDCDVYVITPEQRWGAEMKAGATDDTPADIDIGAGYKLDLTSSHWTIDGDTAATEGCGFVIEGYNSDQSAVDGGKVFGRFGRLACLGVEG